MNDPDYEKKIEALRSRLEQEPAAMPVKVALAEALFRSAIQPSMEPVEALKRLNEAISIDHFRPAFHYHRGLQWHRLGNLERALTNYGRALHFDPRNARVMHQMALAHLDAERFDEARKKWKEAEEAVNQKRQEARGKEADNEDEKKKNELTQTRALFVIQCGRAEVSLREGKADDALQCLKKVKPPRGCASLVGEMALKYLLTTGAAQAVREWLQEKLEPNEREKVLERLQPYLNAYEPATDGAFPLNATSEPSSRHVQALRALVAFDWARQNANGSHGGLPALQQMLSEHPDDEPLVHACLAFLHAEAARLYKAGDWHEAASFWRQALLLDPYNPGVALNLALTATRAKQEKNYQKWWSRAERLWYTRLFILPEAQTYQRLIAEKHLAFAAKAAEIATRPLSDGAPLEALSLWVDEMERYFLAEQYSLRSAYYLIGVPQSAKQEATDEAYHVMKAKTEIYSDNTLPALKDGLKRSRLEKLEQAYQAIGTDEARRAYPAPKDQEEIVRAQKLRDRKVAYLIAVSDHLEQRGKDLPADSANDYARIVKRLLAHPFKALQRQFQDKGKADATTEASAWLRQSLAGFYFEHLFNLLKKSGHGESAEYGQAERLLHHLRELNPRHWKSLFEWAQIERTMGNARESLSLARAALSDCPYADARQVIKQFIGETGENADAYAVNRYLNPAVAHMNKEEWAAAIPLLERAISRSPSMPILHLYLARCLVEEKRFANARKYIASGKPYANTDELRKGFADLARAIDDAEIAPFNDQADACMKRQDWLGALRHLDEAIRVNAQHALIHVRRAHCLLALDIEAIKNGSKPRSKTSVADVHTTLQAARACRNADEFKEAIQSMEQQLREVENQLN